MHDRPLLLLLYRLHTGEDHASWRSWDSLFQELLSGSQLLATIKTNSTQFCFLIKKSLMSSTLLVFQDHRAAYVQLQHSTSVCSSLTGNRAIR